MISFVFNDMYMTELGNFIVSIDVILSGWLRLFAQKMSLPEEK